MSLPAEAGLDRLLAREDLSGAFFFHGDAHRLRDEAVRRLVDAALDPATRDFNLTVFRGGDADPEALASALAMPPMMAPRRVVVLSEAEQLAPTGRKAVEATVRSLPPELAFVISATIPKGSKAGFYRTLKDECTTLEWRQPKEAEVPGWAMERARSRYGFSLVPEAAQAVADAVGADISILDAELAKLASAAEDGELSLERLRALVPTVRRVDRWEWLDRVAARRYDAALRDLDGILTGESAVGLLASMVDQHLYLGVALDGGGAAVREVLSEAGKPYLRWKASTYARQAKAWTAGELERALRLMRRADRQLKTGGTDAGVLRELLVALRLLAERAA